MSKYSLYTVLACHGLEDFPTHHQGASAHGLLTCLTSLWHPSIIAQAQSLPRWCRIDQVPEQCAQTIVLVPSIVQAQLPTGLAERILLDKGCMIQGDLERSEIVARSLAYFDCPRSAETDRLADDFFALGFAYWQVQLMTRQLRYSSHLDEVHLQNVVVAAASALGEQRFEECQRGLQAAFDLLIQERNRYFPVEAMFIDLVLVAPTTLGESLSLEIQSPTPTNLLLTGELIEKVARRQPTVVENMCARLAESTLEIVGGSAAEPRFSLLSLESLNRQFQRGRASLQKIIGAGPSCFARRRFGITSVLPQVLVESGYRGAIHALFDQGGFPPAASGSIEWQSPDGSVIAALSATPIDAAQPDGFARLGISIGESFDASHGATMLFTHWPMKRSIWFEDLVRSMKYGNVLGRFVTMSEYFSKASFSGRRERYSEDQYRSEFLVEAISAKQLDPLSRVVDYWRNHLLLTQCRSLQVMRQLLVQGLLAGEDECQISERTQALNDDNVDRCEGLPTLFADREIPSPETEASKNSVDADDSDALGMEIQSLVSQQKAQFADRLCHSDRRRTDPQLIVANPVSFARRVVCPVGPAFQSVQVEKPIYAADVGIQGGFLAIDVPPFGFAIVSSKGGKSVRRRSQPSIVDGHHLRNEFFDLELDPRTGGVRSIHSYDRRGNLFSQMLGLRLPPGRRTTAGLDAAFAQLDVRSIETLTNSSMVGKILVRGQLLVDDKPVANFEQQIVVARGRRVIELEFEIEPLEALTSDPWRHYYCSRFAWPNEAAELYRAVNETRCPINESRFEAPQWIEIVDGPSRVSILTNGLPFHRRYDYRKLDSLLRVFGERRSRFRLGIGIDVPVPMQAAIDFAVDPLVWETDAASQVQQSSAWLMRTDCRNVLITAIELISSSDVSEGIRLRLKETEGRAGRGRIECARAIVSARRVRLDGESKSELTCTEGAVEFGYLANEYLQIDLRW